MAKKNKYMTLVTEVGRSKIMRATQTGKKLNLTTIKLGDGNGGNYDINEKQTQLKNVVYENSISSYSIDPINDNILYIEAIIGSSVGPFWIREFGVFDEEGDLIIVGNYEETYKAVAQEGSTMELYIKIAVILSNIDSVEIKVDPSVLLASKIDLERIYKLIGDLGRGSELFQTTESCASMLIELKKDLNGINLLDSNVYMTNDRGDKTSQTLKEYLKALNTKIGNIDFDTELNELKQKDESLLELIKQYKAAVDEYNSWLGITVESHTSANEKLRVLLKGK